MSRTFLAAIAVEGFHLHFRLYCHVIQSTFEISNWATVERLQQSIQRSKFETISAVRPRLLNIIMTRNALGIFTVSLVLQELNRKEPLIAI